MSYTKFYKGNLISICAASAQPLLQRKLRKILSTVGKVNMEHQLDATITVLLISKISSTCFGQTFAHLHLI
jgi:hypothetical protein